MQAQFQHSLRTVAQLGDTVNRILNRIAGCRQRRLPGRPYPRHSRKPVGKWRVRKAKQAATSASSAPNPARSAGVPLRPFYVGA